MHMVSSLDGFIASTDGSYDWFESSWTTYEKGKAQENVEQFLSSIDCYIIGSHTYELALTLGWPYGEKTTYVVTSRALSSERKNIKFYSGDLEELVNGLLKSEYKNIWLVGGASLCQDFLNRSLVDEIRLEIVPILLGDGLPLFGNTGKELKLDLKDVAAYKNGMLEVCYSLSSDNVDLI